MKNLHRILYFSTLKATLNFMFALQLLVLWIEVSNKEKLLANAYDDFGEFYAFFIT